MNSKSGDGLGQQYVCPAEAVQKRGADIVIVGRGITEADDPRQIAKEYKESAFNAYESLLGD